MEKKDKESVLPRLSSLPVAALAASLCLLRLSRWSGGQTVCVCGLCPKIRQPSGAEPLSRPLTLTKLQLGSKIRQNFWLKAENCLAGISASEQPLASIKISKILSFNAKLSLLATMRL